MAALARRAAPEAGVFVNEDHELARLLGRCQQLERLAGALADALADPSLTLREKDDLVVAARVMLAPAHVRPLPG